MVKRDLTKNFIDEVYSKPPIGIYPTNKIVYNHIDEITSIDLSDYKTSINKGYRRIVVIIDIFSKYLWALPLKTKISLTITQEFSNILTTSKRSPGRIESDRGAELYNSTFQKLLESKNIQHFSRFTDKGPSLAERVIRTIGNLLKKPIILAGNANLISELPSVIKQYNNTIHSSVKMTPIQASKKSNEKKVSSNLQDGRVKQQPKYKLGQLVRTTDIKRVFVKVIVQVTVILFIQKQK